MRACGPPGIAGIAGIAEREPVASFHSIPRNSFTLGAKVQRA